MVAAFARDRRVTRDLDGRGFGRGALKVDGKIFAMVSSRGELVVKLSADRAAELVRSEKGEPFTAGRGRPMREWLVVRVAPGAQVVPLAREARAYVGG
jgi:hypothetical protein